MGRLVNPPDDSKIHWIIATGYAAENFIAKGAGPCDVTDETDLSTIRWFESEWLANQHPAALAYAKLKDIEKQLVKLEQLKNPQAYSAKQFDAWRYRQAFPTQELSDAQDFDLIKDQYKDMAIDVSVDESTAWEASGAILAAIDENVRQVELYRRTNKKQLTAKLNATQSQE